MKWIAIFCLVVQSSFAFAAPLTVIHHAQTTVFSEQELKNLFKPVSFSTPLPWYETRKTFKGIKVADILDYLNISEAENVTFRALNDYSAPVGYQDLIRYQAVIAYEMDGEKMKIRNKGPYWLVFNLLEYPEIDTGHYHSMMVWQLTSIEVD